MVAGHKSGNFQRAVGLGIGGRLFVRCIMFCVLKDVWPWWRESYDSEGVWTWPRGSLWCVLQGVWMGLWWRHRRKKVRISGLKGFEWWLWWSSRGSTTESMGRGEAVGEDVEGDIPLGGRSDSQGMERCILDRRIKGLERGVLKIDELDSLKRCVLLGEERRVKRCVFGVNFTASKRAQGGIARGFLTYLKRRSVGRGSSMAEEVAKLMSNLNFSEEELIEVEPMEGLGQEQQSETEKWVVAKLFTMRKFGEWLKVPLIRKRNGSQGDRRQSIVYTDKEMGGVGKGKQSEGNMQAGPRSGGRVQQGNGTYIRPRGPKRVLQGKYELCTPVGSKKARSASSSLVIEDDGNLEVVSPLKTTSTVEAVEQPRREP
ncbi:hypothetical protein V6N13_116929 [Hibiscus sabdariffa]|uniref:DUF4283 domain-containing protein n=1 Tax=Hibiscus sabdariffa TaxID=183260 RepID=A0ABR1ZUZ9_9ROSI